MGIKGLIDLGVVFCNKFGGVFHSADGWGYELGGFHAEGIVVGNVHPEVAMIRGAALTKGSIATYDRTNARSSEDSINGFTAVVLVTGCRWAFVGMSMEDLSLIHI